MFRNFARLALNAGLLAVLPIVALAQQPPAPAAPPPADPNAAAAQQFSINQNVGDWVVRCVLTSVKSPAPCEILQSTVNKDNQAAHIEYVHRLCAEPRDLCDADRGADRRRARQGIDARSALNAVKFTRCERDGCYVEMLIDNAAITSLAGAGKGATIGVVGYGRANEIKLPVSLTGFPGSHGPDENLCPRARRGIAEQCSGAAVGRSIHSSPRARRPRSGRCARAGEAGRPLTRIYFCTSVVPGEGSVQPPPIAL